MLRVRYPDLQCMPLCTMVESLCANLSRAPFRHQDAVMLLSVSAGFAHEGRGGSISEAAGRLAISTLPPSASGGEGYRSDMRQAVALVEALQRGTAFLTWRPVVRAADHGTALYHEATMARLDRRGAQVDCAEAYVALERLQLAHIVDGMILARVVDELKRDHAACLCVPVSAQSLSLSLHGENCGWNDIVARLKADRSLSRRLVIEIADNDISGRLQDMVLLVRSLRALGVRFAVGRVGSGQASIERLKILAPDVVKLESSFLHTAYRSERSRRRFSRLLDLGWTLCPNLIVDGIESPWHLRVAMEEGVEWVAGYGPPCATTRWTTCKPRKRDDIRHVHVCRDRPERPALPARGIAIACTQKSFSTKVNPSCAVVGVTSEYGICPARKEYKAWRTSSRISGRRCPPTRAVPWRWTMTASSGG